MALQAKLGILTATLQDLEVAHIAFSGGLDSRFLAHMAQKAGAEVHLYHLQGPQMPARAFESALAWAARRNFPLTAIVLNVLDKPEVAQNSRLRCYVCKRAIMSALLAEVKKRHLEGVLCDGSNTSDMSAFRPGVQALQELGVRSPLAEAGLTKPEVRQAAAQTGLDRPGQPSDSCLLTRFAYGININQEKLLALGQAEERLVGALKQAGQNLNCPVPNFRLRIFDETAGPFQGELHLQGPLPEGFERVLAETAALQGLALPAVKVLERLSGYHDHQ